MVKSEGWKIADALNIKQIEDYRRLATQREVKLEDRLWYAALAEGREEAFNEFKKLLE